MLTRLRLGFYHLRDLKFRSDFKDTLNRLSFDSIGAETTTHYFLYWNFCNVTARKVSKYKIFFGPYFPIIGLNTRKSGPAKIPYLDTFHAVVNRAILINNLKSISISCSVYSDNNLINFLLYGNEKVRCHKESKNVNVSYMNHQRFTEVWRATLMVISFVSTLVYAYTVIFHFCFAEECFFSF